MDNISLSFVGDLCLGKNVRDTIDITTHGSLFSHVEKRLKETDLRFGNLECVIIPSQKSSNLSKELLWVNEVAADELHASGFEIVSLANNHILDFGQNGIDYTTKILAEKKIQHVGLGRSTGTARSPVIIEKKGFKIGFLAYADDEGQKAKHGKLGYAEAILKDIIEDIDNVKELADIVVVSLHMGIEFASCPSPYQITISRQAVEAGAHLVIGHHPHVIQGYEIYKGGLIAYSLGKFVFKIYNNAYQEKWLPFTSWSMILQVTFSKKGYSRYKICPVIIQEDHLPHLASSSHKELILKHIEKISYPLQSPRAVEILYRQSCHDFSLVNRNWLKADLLYKGPIAFLKRLFYLVSRSSNRRWIATYLKSLLHYPLPKA